MGDAPKSAWEIALEKLQKQDRERGEAGPAALSDDQKKAVADVRARFQAKLAELEILHAGSRRKAAGDPEALEKAEEEYHRERRRIEGQRDQAITAARGGGSGRKKKST
jgi:hypothetical protein